MEKFLRKMFVFILIPLFTIGILEIAIYFINDKIFKENSLDDLFYDESSQYSWINTMEADSIIVLAGSSSVRYGLSCNELNAHSDNQFKFVNVAMDARDPIASYFIVKNMNLKKVSAIYFGLDPWIYTKRYYKYRNKYMYLDFKFWDILLFSIEHDKSALLKRYKSLAELISLNKQKKANEMNSKVPSDFGSVALDKYAINFNDPINNWFQIDKYGWSDLQFNYLRKLKDLCKTKNIKFVVFIPPKRSDFSYIYQNECKSAHNEFVSKLQTLEIDPLVIGHFDELERIGDSIYFAEAFHLNRKGQKKYSELFYRMMQNDTMILTPKYDWFLNDNNVQTK